MMSSPIASEAIPRSRTCSMFSRCVSPKSASIRRETDASLAGRAAAAHRHHRARPPPPRSRSAMRSPAVTSKLSGGGSASSSLPEAGAAGAAGAAGGGGGDIVTATPPGGGGGDVATRSICTAGSGSSTTTRARGCLVVSRPRGGKNMCARGAAQHPRGCPRSLCDTHWGGRARGEKHTKAHTRMHARTHALFFTTAQIATPQLRSRAHTPGNQKLETWWRASSACKI
jgi:hypothetical protein